MRKINRVMNKKSDLTSKKLYEKTSIANVKRKDAEY